MENVNYSQQELEELNAQQGATPFQLTQYRINREREYPPIGDQLDALWKGGDAATEMLQKIQAVKEKYPKPQ